MFLRTKLFKHARTHTHAHRCFDTQVPLHRCRNTQTHMECFHTFRLICAQVPAHKHLYTQRFYTDVLVHRCFYTDAFTRSCFYTHTVASAHKCLTHRMFYIHPLHTEMLYNFTHTQTNFYTELIYVNFTHRNFCAQILLHTDVFAQRCLFTQRTLPTEGFCLHRSVHTDFNADASTHRQL